MTIAATIASITPLTEAELEADRGAALARARQAIELVAQESGDRRRYEREHRMYTRLIEEASSSQERSRLMGQAIRSPDADLEMHTAWVPDRLLTDLYRRHPDGHLTLGFGDRAGWRSPGALLEVAEEDPHTWRPIRLRSWEEMLDLTIKRMDRGIRMTLENPELTPEELASGEWAGYGG